MLKKQKPLKRGSGTLLPVASLPSSYGIGTFGKSAYDFIDFLKQSKQKYWQVLPLGPTGYGDSPYQSFSAFAGNPYFIDLEILIQEDLIQREDAEAINWGDSPDRVDYAKIYENRFDILRKAFSKSSHKEEKDYLDFCTQNSFWLDDYSLYMAIKDYFGGVEWLKWPEDIRLRKPQALEIYCEKLKEEIEFWNFTQYKFTSQFQDLRNYAKKSEIEIIGDIPIYVALDSADTWVNTDQFQMDEDHRPLIVAGVPPDMFSKTGQLWGNPIYDWDYMKKDDFSWWRKRMKYSASLYDIIRIDHFIGIINYYSVKYGAKTAMGGEWKKGPGEDLLSAINQATGDTLIIAEDLGVVTPEVTRVLKLSGYPGMRLMQFGFDANPRNTNLAKYFDENSVVYPGTHDNETLRGYFENATDKTRANARKILRTKRNRDLVWLLIETAFKSRASTVIFQIQDYLELDNRARTNIPSTIGGNWSWRLLPGQASSELGQRIGKLAEKYKR